MRRPPSQFPKLSRLGRDILPPIHDPVLSSRGAPINLSLSSLTCSAISRCDPVGTRLRHAVMASQYLRSIESHLAYYACDTDLFAANTWPTSAKLTARTSLYGCKWGSPLNGSWPLDGGTNERANSTISVRTIASSSTWKFGTAVGPRDPRSGTRPGEPIVPITLLWGARR